MVSTTQARDIAIYQPLRLSSHKYQSFTVNGSLQNTARTKSLTVPNRRKNPFIFPSGWNRLRGLEYPHVDKTAIPDAHLDDNVVNILGDWAINQTSADVCSWFLRAVFQMELDESNECRSICTETAGTSSCQQLKADVYIHTKKKPFFSHHYLILNQTKHFLI